MLCGNCNKAMKKQLVCSRCKAATTQQAARGFKDGVTPDSCTADLVAFLQR
jgi:hypothetical protein